MLGIAAISLWSFLLLVKTRLVIPGSFGGEPERFSSFKKKGSFLIELCSRYGWHALWKLVPPGHLDLDRPFANRFRLR